MATQKTKTDKQLDFEKHSDEVRLDSDRRARDMVDYEQMLMRYVEDYVTGKANIFNEQ